jgi:hypothetical protein
MPQFIRIGESLINLEWVRAVEYAADGRMNVWLAEDRGSGLVLRYSGEEAREAWAVLTNNKDIRVLNALPLEPGDRQV